MKAQLLFFGLLYVTMCQSSRVAAQGVCPSTEGMAGICMEACTTDSDCSGDNKCCSNGCGHRCMAPVVPTDTTGVLRVVSTLVSPYLIERKYKPTEAADVTTTDATPTASNMTAQGNETENATISSGTTEVPRTPSPYEGFVPDMMDIMLQWLEGYDSYEITVVSSEGDKSSYDIMMEYVQQGKADVAAAPMTVTLGKERKVDFTYAFQSFEATIVIDATHQDRIKTLSDLVYQEEDDEHQFLNYGVRRGGAIHKYLETSDDPVHRSMMEYFQKTMTSLKGSDNDGIWLVRTGNSAYIMEGSYANWVIGQPPCELVGVPAGFFRRQYAFAVAQRSPLREKLNEAIVEVKYDGSYQQAAEKWLHPTLCESAGWHVRSSVLSMVISILVSFWLG